MSRQVSTPAPTPTPYPARRRRRAGALLAAGALAAVTVTVSPLAASAASGPEPGAGPGRPLNGERAVAALGGELPEAAARNRRSPDELVRLLREDPTMWLGPGGRLLVRDTAVPDAPAAAAVEAAPYPTASTFRLHSRPGARRVIYLDFDGHTVTGTEWNRLGISTRPQPAFDIGGTPGRWTRAEHDVVQSVFQRVAEDYAPFDVDVTTEDPGAAALTRGSAADTRYGTRVLITPSREADVACGAGAGGCAFLGVFDVVGNASLQPAWVFSDRLYNDAKYIGEAASHEAGHNLGLSHDGTSEQPYYSGHDNWAPIMGIGYLFSPLTQWSRGEYLDANNREDDVAVMQRFGLPLRADDHDSTTATATRVGAGHTARGLIRSRVDRDMFSFTRGCAGTATVTARPAPTSPNLDIKLRLLDAAGVVLAQDDPPSAIGTFDVATGLAASVTVALKPGTYYAEVDGVGVRTPATGYSDYGSRGPYTLEFPRCPLAPTSRLLLAPADLRSVAGGGWATRGQDLAPKASVEPLASCSGTATLSPSVARTFATTVRGRTLGQRVVRYRPGRGDAVVDLFRAVLERCPVRATPAGVRERWTALVDTAGTGTDTLVLRRSPVGATRARVSYRVVVRDGDVVSVLGYGPGAGAAGDDAGARTLARVSAARLRAPR